MIPDRYTRRGAAAPNAALTPRQVKRCRERWDTEQPRPTIQRLADEAGVAYETMRRVVRRLTYRDEEAQTGS